MAVLSATRLVDPQPVGEYVISTVRVTPGAAAADEWISASDLGMSWVIAVLGCATDSHTAGNPTLPTFELNARGSGVGAGTNPGDLGIEDVAGSVSFFVTAIGRPA